MSERVDLILTALGSSTVDERRQLRAYLTGEQAIYATSTRPSFVVKLISELTPAEREELLVLLGDDDDDGHSRVREPRGPRKPRTGAGGAVADESSLAEREAEVVAR